MRNVILISFLICFALLKSGAAQQPGDKVELFSTKSRGVSVRQNISDRGYFKWPNGTMGTVVAIDPKTGMFRIRSRLGTGWVQGKFVNLIYESKQ